MSARRLWSPVQLMAALDVTDWCDWAALVRNGTVPPPDKLLARGRPRWHDATVRRLLGEAYPDPDPAGPDEIVARLEAGLQLGGGADEAPSAPALSGRKGGPRLLAARSKPAGGRLRAPPA